MKNEVRQLKSVAIWARRVVGKKLLPICIKKWTVYTFKFSRSWQSQCIKWLYNIVLSKPTYCQMFIFLEIGQFNRNICLNLLTWRFFAIRREHATNVSHMSSGARSRVAGSLPPSPRLIRATSTPRPADPLPLSPSVFASASEMKYRGTCRFAGSLFRPRDVNQAVFCVRSRSQNFCFDWREWDGAH